MELKRLEKAIADKWGLIVVMALVGVAAALLFSTFSARNQTSLFQAEISVRFVAPEGGTIADLADDLDEAYDTATIAAAELIDADPLDPVIVEDLANARLSFIAQGSTENEAESKARAMLQAFIELDPTAGGTVIDLIEEVQEEAITIQTQIQELEALRDANEDLIAEHAFLDAQEQAIRGRLVELVVAEASADSETRQAIASERAALDSQLAALESQREALDPEPTGDGLTVEQSLQLAALQGRMTALTEEYQRLFLRQQGVIEGAGVEAASVQDLTPEPPNSLVVAAIGLLGGLLIAVLAIMFINRTRRPVWLEEDIGLPLLGDVPARKVSADTAENWYDEAPVGPRKAALQALRSSIEAQLPSTGATLAVTSLNVDAEGVQALAADLSSALASAGTSVLLIDANFDSRSPLGQYKPGGVSVAGALAIDPTVPEFDATVRFTVESAPRLRPGLSILPSGPPPASSADSLAGRQFRQLIAFAQEMYDLVVVAVDPIDTPSAQVALQRLGHGILVLTPGTSSMTEVSGLLRDIERLRIQMLGSVFLSKEGRLLPKPSSQSGKSRSTPVVADPVQVDDQPRSPISRLQSYSAPEERTTGNGAGLRGSLDNLIDSIGSDKLGDLDAVGVNLINALDSAQPDKAAEKVASYLVAQTEDMVLARPGDGGLSPTLVSEMSDFGFMSLRKLNGFNTPAQWLRDEVASETGQVVADELLDAMEKALGRGRKTLEVDAWLDEEFFIRHLEKTEGQPTVWHLASPERAVSLLVPARRLTTQHFELVLGEVVTRTLDDLESQRADAVTKADLDAAATVEAQIADARQFEERVNSLISGEPATWSPDWSKGTRSNLAPLQAAGILPFQVLSPDEMADLVA